jgi:hypothetical protein
MKKIVAGLLIVLFLVTLNSCGKPELEKAPTDGTYETIPIEQIKTEEDFENAMKASPKTYNKWVDTYNLINSLKSAEDFEKKKGYLTSIGKIYGLGDTTDYLIREYCNEPSKGNKDQIIQYFKFYMYTSIYRDIYDEDNPMNVSYMELKDRMDSVGRLPVENRYGHTCYDNTGFYDKDGKGRDNTSEQYIIYSDGAKVAAYQCPTGWFDRWALDTFMTKEQIDKVEEIYDNCFDDSNPYEKYWIKVAENGYGDIYSMIVQLDNFDLCFTKDPLNNDLTIDNKGESMYRDIYNQYISGESYLNYDNYKVVNANELL